MKNVTHGTWLESRPPDVVGPSGKAWRVQFTPTTALQTAAVAAWLLYAPDAHPVWAYWGISVVHLRAIPGEKPANKTHDDVTHEFLIIAHNPLHAPPDPIGWGNFHHLVPIDVCEQFQVPTDEAAARLCAQAVIVCCRGLISPDQDFREIWKRVIAETAAHHRGEHGDHR